MSQSTSADQLKPAVGQLLGIAKTVERDDLIDRIKAAAIRATRSDTVVCVVGEFKQGKSSLVNSLVRRNVCPVDDDLATSVITMLHHGEPAGAIVRSKENGKPVAKAIDVDDVASFASEQGNPGNEKGVDRVDITLPAAILEGGLTLVDTPGMGGLGGGHAAATLSFLPFADGLILVSDTSSELTAPEVDFLK
ncbi:MAG: putative GTPase, partial [Ilumatobacter sp.]